MKEYTHIHQETQEFLYSPEDRKDLDTRTIPGFIRRYVAAEFEPKDDAMRRLLGQLVYWTTPSDKSKSGEFTSRMTQTALGKVWIRKSLEDWADECDMSMSVLKRKLNKLEELGVVERQSITLGAKCLLVRFNEDSLLSIHTKYGKPKTINRDNKSSKSVKVKGQNDLCQGSKRPDQRVKTTSLRSEDSYQDSYEDSYERMNEETIYFGNKIFGPLDPDSRWGKKYAEAIKCAIEAGGLGSELLKIVHIARAEYKMEFNLGKWQNFAYNIHPESSNPHYRSELELRLGELALNPRVSLDLRIEVLELKKYKLHARSGTGVILDNFDILNIFDKKGICGFTDTLVDMFNGVESDLDLKPMNDLCPDINKPSDEEKVEHMKRMAREESYNMELSGVMDQQEEFKLLLALREHLDTKTALENLKTIPEDMQLVVLDYTVRVLRYIRNLPTHLVEFDKDETFEFCEFAA